MSRPDHWTAATPDWEHVRACLGLVAAWVGLAILAAPVLAFFFIIELDVTFNVWRAFLHDLARP